MMKYAIAPFLIFGLWACSPASNEAEVSKSSVPNLKSYEASEFEPNWFLKLFDGNTIEFTQLDPVAGEDLVTYSYKIIASSETTDGWDIQGEGKRGNIALRILRDQNCSHSGSGYLHRDTVLVIISTTQWRGCGGEIIQGE